MALFRIYLKLVQRRPNIFFATTWAPLIALYRRDRCTIRYNTIWKKKMLKLALYLPLGGTQGGSTWMWQFYVTVILSPTPRRVDFMKQILNYIGSPIWSGWLNSNIILCEVGILFCFEFYDGGHTPDLKAPPSHASRRETFHCLRYLAIQVITKPFFSIINHFLNLTLPFTVPQVAILFVSTFGTAVKHQIRAPSGSVARNSWTFLSVHVKLPWIPDWILGYLAILQEYHLLFLASSFFIVVYLTSSWKSGTS